MSALDFPPPSRPEAAALAALAQTVAGARAITLRPATTADIGFLRELYAQRRAPELAHVPWPAPLKRDFLDQQFTLQHRHYTTHFPAADFLLIEQRGRAIGRLYLDRPTDADWHLIDIGLVSTAQGHGIGSALIGQVLAMAARHGVGVGLHVALDNPRAQTLYTRLGFCPGAVDGAYRAMRCATGEAVS